MRDDDGSPAQSVDDFAQEQSRLFAEGFSFSGYERDLVALNRGDAFEIVSGVSGADSVSDGRGAVFADLDNDGDTDILLRALQGQALHLFRNNVGSDAGFIRISLEGTTSGRDAYGAVVRLMTDSGPLAKTKSGGSGFVSQSDPRLLFGLGKGQQVREIHVRWPSGLEQVFPGARAGDSLLLIEGDPLPHPLDEHRFTLPAPRSPEELAWAALKVRPGDLLPSLPVTALDGSQHDLRELLPAGRPALVNLWATWCRSCRAEMPELQRLHRVARDIAVVGISVDEPDRRERIPGFVAALGITYPVVTIDQEQLEALVRTTDTGIPLTLVIDGEGRVTELIAGWSPEAHRRLEAVVRAGR